MELKTIGTVQLENGYEIHIAPEYRRALDGLHDFGYVQVLWWAHMVDREDYRQVVNLQKPYVKGPDSLGVLATRSPSRPNPLALSTVPLGSWDPESGVLSLAYIDAENNTPVLDLKPYLPAVDLVATATVPQWCDHWPKKLEDSMAFDWAAEFNF